MIVTKPSTGRVEPGALGSVAARRLQALAGALYATTGFGLLMGIITAETKYPVWRHYSTRQEVSDLGGMRPPHSVVTQPAATIFDVTMIVASVLLLVEAWAAWQHYRLSLAGAATMLMVGYEAAWVRYFAGGQPSWDFYRSLAGVPLPLSTLPVAAFLLLGVYGRLWPLIGPRQCRGSDTSAFTSSTTATSPELCLAWCPVFTPPTPFPRTDAPHQIKRTSNCRLRSCFSGRYPLEGPSPRSFDDGGMAIFNSSRMHRQ